MGYDLWRKLRRYLVLWLVMLLVLVLAVVIVNWDVMSQYFQGSLQSSLGLLVSCLVIIGLVVMIFRAG